MTLSFSLNGEPQRVELASDASLLEVLRDSCGIRSTKDGCSPQGQCGCCLALVDGRAVTTCAMPAARAAGREVVTLEGLPEETRARYALAFVAAAGIQCGFCIPGIVLRTHHLLTKTSPSTPLTRDAIAKALDVHLCRCTGYVKIIDAIEVLARGDEAPPCDDGRVGRPLARVRGVERTLGTCDFVADMRRDTLLEGALLLSQHARARVRAIDVSAARAVEGVRAVVTAADVPGERWYGLLVNDWPGLVAAGEEVRCAGDVLAAVAAVDARTARLAVSKIRVEYEPLPPVLDPEDALRDDAPHVNPKAASNLLSHTVIRRGDADAALAESAHVVEGVWETQRIEHAFLEPESALAEPLDGGRLRLYTQGQGIYDDRRQVAAFTGLPEDAVDVVLVPNGGAFGGKEDLSVQAHAALLAQVSGQPVRVTLSRDESVRMHPKRHPMRMHYRVGCDADGRLTAVHARIVGDSGAYASVGAKVLERAAGHACGPYRVPHVDVEARAVYTNHPPCGAMRGFGVNQTAFAIEGAVDRLAALCGLDPFGMRWRNALEVGDTFATGQVLEHSVGLKATLAAVRETWQAARARGQAVGIACGLKNSGIGNGVVEFGKARLVVEPDAHVTIFNGYTEMGQGLLTVLTQFAVEATGLPASTFRVKVDSTYALDCGQTTGSRATLFGGRAVLSAAAKLRADLEQGHTLADLAGRVYAADVTVDDTTSLNDAGATRIKTHTAFSYATQVCLLDSAGRVERIIAAHDVGRVVNPALCSGQIEGSVHMGMGYALTEELACERGVPVTSRLRDLGVLRAKDMPAVDVILVEAPTPEGPMGAKGVGEIGLVPTAPAVAAALHAFDGEWRYTLPMRASAAARAMSVGRSRVE
ncbi:MAG: selenium-dependent xanthine dehydrogenase [Proteobacteria bacterium]|nr:selenium-dependent xanthine dehydrogenase [Pseudomonadota bacterium]